MTSKYFPLSDWMVIEPDVSKVSNLILPDGADDPSKDESRVFIVKRVGPGYWDMNQWIEPKVHEGDKILVAGFGLSEQRVQARLTLSRRCLSLSIASVSIRDISLSPVKRVSK